jgi:hypothetical protein
MSTAKAPRVRVVVDGSNFATEGRTIPNLVQLDEAVRAFLEENPAAEIIVVVDASFEHRVAPNERARFKESELAGEIVTPPAGAVGRGDAFILKIAHRIGGIVLSNDSFQEFHEEYPWLFDVGRLIGGKPVAGVGWVFTPRLPVRGAKSVRKTKKLAVALPGGAKPTIGTTLTPVKALKAPAKRPAAKSAKVPAKPVKKVPKRPTEAPKKTGATKVVAEKAPKAPAKRTRAKKVAPLAPVLAKDPAPGPTALRRGRHPVNPEAEFTLFRTSHKIGARVDGEVTAFSSHGALVQVALRGDRHVECYAPTTLLGDPAPARARDVLKRGDRRSFRLVTVDVERRIAELSLP